MPYDSSKLIICYSLNIIKKKDKIRINNNTKFIGSS